MTSLHLPEWCPPQALNKQSTISATAYMHTASEHRALYCDSDSNIQ